ncbi:hypothetical protein DL96DRAFT_1705167 [Flagelloscypha sp. PMI_526]|nr:hypothetical protein DL96DRAFT_1705167 [Flagelloscypha sp. PMI_526]
MSKNPHSSLRPLRLFDGDDFCALFQAKILQETLYRISYDGDLAASNSSRPISRVADSFGMVCRSGLLAIMTGILGMTGAELVDEFTSLSLAVFSGDATVEKRTARLELENKRMVKKYSPPEQGEIGNDLGCKPMQSICASQAIFKRDLTFLLRSNASLGCKVWKAAAAPCALVGIFASVAVDSIHIQVANIFTGHDIACIVSVGLITLKSSPSLKKIIISLDESPKTVNGSRTTYSIASEINSADIRELTKVLASTHSYLEASRPKNDVDAIIKVLTAAKGLTSVTVVAGQISVAPEAQHLRKLRPNFANKAHRFYITVLSGLGGAGKTQCSLMFVQLSLDENRFVLHLFHASLETRFKSIAQAKGAEESFEDGLRYLQMRSDEWLLLLDNADEPNIDTGQYPHRQHGNVLITLETLTLATGLQIVIAS